MAQELEIDVTFLRGIYEAGGDRDSDVPSWPPAPARLVNALVSCCDDEADFEAIEWLEQRDPPSIDASETTACGGRQSYVPTNQIENKPSWYRELPARKALGPRGWSARSLAEPTVSYRWELGEGDAEMAQRVMSVAARVPYLGRSTSPVLVHSHVTSSSKSSSVQDQRQSWVPTDGGDVLLATPRRGYVAGLRRAFDAGQQPWEVSPRLVAYETDTPQVETTIASPYGEMLILGFKGGRRFGPNQAMLLASRLRDAIESHLNGGPVILRGERNAQGEHFVSVTALPFVGTPYARGQLMGMAVILPRRISPDDRAAVLRGLRLTVENDLKLGRLGVVRLDPQPSPLHTLRARTWTRPSFTWVSALPITANRYLRKVTPEAIAADAHRALEHLGLSATDIVVNNGPLTEGASNIRPQFRLHGHEQPKPSYHALIRFDTEVEGPLLLGSQRTYGLGLMLPTTGRRNQRENAIQKPTPQSESQVLGSEAPPDE